MVLTRNVHMTNIMNLDKKIKCSSSNKLSSNQKQELAIDVFENFIIGRFGSNWLGEDRNVNSYKQRTQSDSKGIVPNGKVFCW